MVHVCTFGAAVAGAVLIGEALDGSPSSELWPLVWVIVILAVPIALFGWLEVVVVHVMSFRLIDDLRTALYERFRVLSPAYFLSRRSGDVARASMADVELLELFTSHLAPPLVVAFVIPVLAEIGLWIVEPSSRSWCCRSSSLPRACRRGCWAAPRTRESACARSSGSWARTSSTSSRAPARSWRPAGRRSCSTGSSASTSGSGATSIAHGRRSGIEHAATDAITSLAAITVVTTTALLATNGSFDAASIPVALILAAGAFAPLASLTGTFREVGQVSAAAERIEALMAAEPLVTDRADESASAARRPQAGRPLRVAFDEVSFRYDDDLPDALARHRVHGRTGRDGRARRTFGRREVDVRQPAAPTVGRARGRGTVGGTDVRDLAQRDLRSSIAVVPQDVYLFHASVAENLRLGDPDARDDDAVRAAARSPRPTRSSIGCPTRTTPSSASAGRRSRAASVSASRSRGPSCVTRRSS